MKLSVIALDYDGTSLGATFWSHWCGMPLPPRHRRAAGWGTPIADELTAFSSRTARILQESAMSQPSEHGVHVPCIAHREEQDLCTRVQAEFLEMPGLRLTLSQASRLFSIEPTRCERVLGALVHAGHLATDGNAFASPRGGRRSA